MKFEIFINRQYHKTFLVYEDALDYVEKLPLGKKVEIIKTQD